MSKPGVIALGPWIQNFRELQTTFKNSLSSKTTPVIEGEASQD